MDATKRPLLIPPGFSTYAEKHGLFDMYKRLVEQLLLHKPRDPLMFLMDLLKKENDDVPQVIVLGPPASGKCSIVRLLCAKLRSAHLTMENLISDTEANMRKKAQDHIRLGEAIPTSLWVKILKDRISLFDCVKKGWILDGFPQTAEQAKALQAVGIYPKHFILLDAPDTVLVERAGGKRIDPKTGDIYHTTFDWPSNADVRSRLEEPTGNTEADVLDKLLLFHRHNDAVSRCYEKVRKVVNADQPKADVFAQVLTFLMTKPCSTAPHTPRILLIGPTGSGKGVQASLLANKYKIVNVSCGRLIKQAIADETKPGRAAKTYQNKGLLVPDNIVINIMKARLSQLDAVTRGWVMHGYPRSSEQADALIKAGFLPNRIFFLDVPNDSVLERLTLRATDPITGERYHMLYNPPRSNDVKDRLQKHPHDLGAQVRKRLADYYTFFEEICEYFAEGQHINADQDPHTVFECIESMIVNPVPKRFE